MRDYEKFSSDQSIQINEPYSGGNGPYLWGNKTYLGAGYETSLGGGY
jgi:hypothetical protein